MTTPKTSSARAALKAEAVEETTVSFEYDGVEYVLDRDAINDVDVIEAFEDNKVATALRTILGPEQWAAFKSRKRTMTELGELSVALFAAFGTSPGESGA